ncbi:MAG: hypothetical protein PHP01_04295 [Phycisphaerae bacterium]|nr:hypothetical protein [Phycisphaerae bacterium]
MGTLTLPVTENLEKFDYAAIPLVELTGRIETCGDRKALTELHENRYLFRYKDDRSLLLVDFLVRLREQPASRRWCNNDQIVLEQAFDLTLSKFLNIPQNNSSSDGTSETSGPDCRYYYKAYNCHVLSQIESKSLDDELEIEFMAAKLFQNHVFRHFYLSCLECRRRQQKLTRRICYEVDGQTLSLWIPAQMTVKMFDKWFRQICSNCGNSSCRHEIQELIDNSLLSSRFVSLDSLDDRNKEDFKNNGFPALMREHITSFGLAETVADEKADNIGDQRPAIRNLGRTRLKELIHRIFNYLGNERNDYQVILSEFSLSKATLSRFAGTRWHNGNGQTYVPDLWKNTAHILANHPDFIEIVKETGLWQKVSRAAGKES